MTYHLFQTKVEMNSDDAPFLLKSRVTYSWVCYTCFSVCLLELPIRGRNTGHTFSVWWRKEHWMLVPWVHPARSPHLSETSPPALPLPGSWLILSQPRNSESALSPTLICFMCGTAFLVNPELVHAVRKDVAVWHLFSGLLCLALFLLRSYVFRRVFVVMWKGSETLFLSC